MIEPAAEEAGDEAEREDREADVLQRTAPRLHLQDDSCGDAQQHPGTVRPGADRFSKDKCAHDTSRNFATISVLLFSWPRSVSIEDFDANRSHRSYRSYASYSDQDCHAQGTAAHDLAEADPQTARNLRLTR